MATDIEVETKPKANIRTLTSVITAACILIFLIANGFKHVSIQCAIVLAVVLSAVYMSWLLFGKIFIRVSEMNLVVIYRLFVPFRKDVFDILKMNVIEKKLNIKSEEPESYIRISFGFFSYVPKSSVKYEVYPVLLEFKYNDKLHIVLGKNWRMFDADSIIHAIKRKQYESGLKKVQH